LTPSCGFSEAQLPRITAWHLLELAHPAMMHTLDFPQLLPQMNSSIFLKKLVVHLLCAKPYLIDTIKQIKVVSQATVSEFFIPSLSCPVLRVQVLAHARQALFH
jgi:hypothetical protein